MDYFEVNENILLLSLIIENYTYSYVKIVCQHIFRVYKLMVTNVKYAQS